MGAATACARAVATAAAASAVRGAGQKRGCDARRAAAKLGDVLEETARVRRELGYPGMATPFSQLVGIQAVLNIVTGKRSYTNMLISTLIETTDKEHENAMMLVIECEQIIIAMTQTVSVGSSANMAQPQNNAATTQVGTVNATPNPPGFNASAIPADTMATQ